MPNAKLVENLLGQDTKLEVRQKKISWTGISASDSATAYPGDLKESFSRGKRRKVFFTTCNILIRIRQADGQRRPDCPSFSSLPPPVGLGRDYTNLYSRYRTNKLTLVGARLLLRHMVTMRYVKPHYFFPAHPTDHP